MLETLNLHDVILVEDFRTDVEAVGKRKASSTQRTTFPVTGFTETFPELNSGSLPVTATIPSPENSTTITLFMRSLSIRPNRCCPAHP